MGVIVRYGIVARTTVAFALVAAGTAGGAAAAAAAVCPSGYACGWGDRYYKTSGSTAARVKAYECQYSLSFLNYEGTTRNADDDITSVYNNGNHSNATFFTGKWYSGASLKVVRQDGYVALNSSHPNMNDSISSFKFDSAAGNCT
ncbi:peptidase inhibitor family I36 protein [Phycicoccus endophyticus]|uniref:Peptidase inhibitor family I36 protein n=1 Tax=Phycicoccus endophyticus TaxID=1690220 RepID=A0A7G9R1J8_9MICO|nr:peptidase inhibitor family I36 protein [Phycicoccus endophyticus]NHI18737.1 hypothetical protein [Phycicoccus endophyticus]QNN49473.1 peptidase inhibitor family I36 protein [Phycicoccus endophyticus]GGL36894.1 hypothetical protein GCM10012283_19270 [Phycicoccus endophyticus]